MASFAWLQCACLCFFSGIGCTVTKQPSVVFNNRDGGRVFSLTDSCNQVTDWPSGGHSAAKAKLPICQKNRSLLDVTQSGPLYEENPDCRSLGLHVRTRFSECGWRRRTFLQIFDWNHNVWMGFLNEWIQSMSSKLLLSFLERLRTNCLKIMSSLLHLMTNRAI